MSSSTAPAVEIVSEPAGPANTSWACALRSADRLAGEFAHVDTVIQCDGDAAVSASSARYLLRIAADTDVRFHVVSEDSLGGIGSSPEADTLGDALLNGGAALPLPPLVTEAGVNRGPNGPLISLRGERLDHLESVSIFPRNGGASGGSVELPIVSLAEGLAIADAASVSPDPSGVVLVGGAGFLSAIELSAAPEDSAPPPPVTKLIVRFEPGQVEPNAGSYSCAVPSGSIPDETLGAALAAAGVDSLVRLLPWFDHDDVNTTNALGEPIVLDDLSDLYVAHLSQGTDATAAAAAIGALSSVRYAGAAAGTYELHGLIPNDPLFGEQWGLRNTGSSVCGLAAQAGADIGATNAWTWYGWGSGVRVGVIDTGVFDTHEDLLGRVVDGYDFTGGGCATCDDYLVPHGTAVASIIAAAGDNTKGMAGIAWRASIVPIRAFTCDLYGRCSGAPATVLQALDWARDQGLPIINMSFGSTDTSRVSLAIADVCGNAVREGLLLVASTGNAQRQSTAPGDNGYLYEPQTHPADSYARVFGVGAALPGGWRWSDDLVNSTKCLHFPDCFECYASNYGSLLYPIVDAIAPGGALITVAGAPTNGYESLGGCTGAEFPPVGFGGTSAAASVASGIAALMKGYEPALDGGDLTHILQVTAHDVDDPGVDLRTGHGFLRADAAMAFIARPRLVAHGRISKNQTSLGCLRVTAIESTNPIPKFCRFPLGWASECFMEATRFTLRGWGRFPPVFQQAPDVWVRPSGSAGWAAADEYDKYVVVDGGDVVPGSTSRDSAEFVTYVYKVPTSAGGYVWLPTDTSQAAIAYTAVGSSATVSVDAASVESARMALWPNPVRGMPTIQLALSDRGTARLGIYDITGRRVWQQVLSGHPHEVVTMRPAVSAEPEAPPGVYWLHYAIGGETGSKPFVVLGSRR